ncbi:ROK family protein [Nonomuraea sp. C10]|nr:ROK family protein [Nonomuraea sp. C10]
MAGAISRAALANRLGLNRSTILALATQLTAAGLVREEASGTTGRVGRPSLVVRPESGRWYVLAFDVAVDRLVAARVGLGGLVLERREAPRRRRHADLDEVVGVLAGFGRELVDAAPRSARCLGVGTSYCGLVRAADGMVLLAPNVGWTNLDFGPALSHRLGLGLPVAVGNEAHLGALAELERGAGIGHQNLVYPHGDAGVGGGIIVGGRLLGGDDGYGAELGHMIVNPFGGTLGDIYQGAAPQVRARVAASVLPVSRRVGLRTSMLRYDASLVGAAELAFSRVLAGPLDALDSTAQ